MIFFFLFLKELLELNYSSKLQVDRDNGEIMILKNKNKRKKKRVTKGSFGDNI